MYKKLLRFLSLALVVLILISVVPAAESSAAASEVDRISQQITSTYKTALRKAGMNSFHGWCGAAVDWQLQVLGITTKVIGSNGNQQFDLYRDQEYSSGGYRIRSYPASHYTLTTALNAITKNGTEDAYNILVGFQRTNTSAGRIYGHACFIHAIIDGKVYFTESYSTTFAGKYYSEGAVISGTIEQFAKYYNSWTTLDGLIHFGLKTYNDGCDFFPAYLYASVSQDTMMYTAPCEPAVDDRSEPLRTLQAGERLSVIGLYRNTEGEYWYEVEDSRIGYVRADHTQAESMRYDDVTVSGISAPTQLRQGNIFNIKGNIKSTYNSITSVRAQVFSNTGEELQHLMTTSASVDDTSYSLSSSTVSNRLAFRLLDIGDYRYEMAVVVGNHYYADGCLQTEWKTIKLWKSDFQVVSQQGDVGSVIFDACGGNTELNGAQIELEQPIGTLPEATREGYVFDGWYTAAEGGEKIDESFIVEDNVTLYACWVEAEDAQGWYKQDGKVYYVMDGLRIYGFFQVDGVTYHQNADGFLDIGWTEVGGMRYYFNTNGSMASGWIELEGQRYYIGMDGTATIGWALIDDNFYYFDELGVMQTGVHVIDGEKYSFDENGVMLPNYGG